MGEWSDAASGRRRWSETRLVRGLLFLGIVWSIAGAFVALRSGLPRLSVAGAVGGWVPAQLSELSSVRAESELRCAASEHEAGETAADEAHLRAARYVALQLGESFGAAGVAVSLGLPREYTDQFLEQARSAAGALGVPAPELPTFRHGATALTEFSDDLVADRQCVAARLASRYSPAHGDAFKFGAVIAHSEFYCLKGVCGVFATYIRLYGQRAGVPEHLWLPLARGSLDGIPGSDAQERIAWLTARRNEYMRAGF